MNSYAMGSARREKKQVKTKRELWKKETVDKRGEQRQDEKEVHVASSGLIGYARRGS